MSKTIEIEGKIYQTNLGEGKYFSLHKYIELRKHPKYEGSFGLFATDEIKKGEVIWCDVEGMTDETKLLTPEQFEKLEEKIRMHYEHFGYRIGDNLYIGCKYPEEVESDPSNYLNHSCDPNTALENDYVMVATRDIAKDEEITMDYCTIAALKEFDCACNTKFCRKKYRREDWMNPELIARYGVDAFSMWMRPKIREIINSTDTECRAKVD